MSRVVFGIHPVLEMLSARPQHVHLVLVRPDPAGRLAKVLDAAHSAKIEQRDATDEELARLTSDGNHQGVAAITGEFEYADPDPLVERIVAERGIALYLDGFTDPRNLGAAIRSAAALGASGVFIPKDRAAGITAGAVRTSAGATEWVPVARVTNFARALEQFRTAGGWVVGAAVEGGVPLWTLDLSGAIGLVVGAEHRALRPLVARTCDHLATIPTLASMPSLNAGAAATVLLYEAARQRMQK